MVQFLQGKVSDRKLRLFACACSRRTWFLLRCKRSRTAIEVAELAADGKATIERLRTISLQVEATANYLCRLRSLNNSPSGPREAARFVGAVLREGAWDAARNAALGSRDAVTTNAYSRAAVNGVGSLGRRVTWDQETRAQVDLLHDIFPAPCCHMASIDPIITTWHDGTVRRLAKVIYEERKLPEGTLDATQLAILADALLDAGFDNDELIQHCRSAGPHVRGCWAVDAVLGKE
jgi:hypothetical protein